MAGRLIEIKSIQLNHEIRECYGIPDESVKSIPFWKRILHKREHPEYISDEGSKFTNNLSFCIFFVALGNSYDGIPISMRLSLVASGGLYIIYQILFTLLLAWPVLYVESFLGEYSLLTNSQMYRMVPLFFGVCVIRIVQDVVFSAFRSVSITLALVATLEHLISKESNCDGDDTGFCFDYFKEDTTAMANCTMRYYALECNGHRSMLVAQFSYWANILRLGNFQANWVVAGTLVVTWLMIIIMGMFRMKIMEMVLKICVIISMLMHTVLFIMALASDGAGSGMKNLIDFQVTKIDLQSFILCAFFVPLRYHAIVGGSYMNYWSQKTFKPLFGFNTNSLFLIMCNFSMHIYKLVIFHAVLGTVSFGSGVPYKEMLNSFDAMFYANVSEFFRVVRCPRPFIACFHFTLWLVECAKLTILIIMHITSLNNFFPRLVRFRLYTRLSWCTACVFISMIFTFGIFLKFFNNILIIVNLYILQAFELIVWSIMIFYGYGLSRLNDDIHFLTGKRPAKMWRFIWSIYPFILAALMLALIMDQLYNRRSDIIFFNDFLYNKVFFDSFFYICISTVASVLIGSFVISFLYIVLTIRASKKIRMTTPLFYWGPIDDNVRIARKAFTPRIAIRSQKAKEYRQRFRNWSVRQQHESDFANRVKNGRMFLDTSFFLNISKKKYVHDTHMRIKSRHSRYSEESDLVQFQMQSAMRLLDRPRDKKESNELEASEDGSVKNKEIYV